MKTLKPGHDHDDKDPYMNTDPTPLRYWLSWYQPGDDHRPITYPPPAGVLGWWCSGYGADDSSTLCACVLAPSPEAAWKIVRSKDAWPDAGAERFCEVRGTDFVPGDRFPLSDWMKERFANAK